MSRMDKKINVDTRRRYAMYYVQFTRGSSIAETVDNIMNAAPFSLHESTYIVYTVPEQSYTFLEQEESNNGLVLASDVIKHDFLA